MYIVAREYDINLRIRVLGYAPEYSLEFDFDVEPKIIDEVQSEVFVNLFEKLLPGVGATDVRGTSYETQAAHGAGQRTVVLSPNPSRSTRKAKPWWKFW
jgi:hypothetical protein